MPEYLKRFWIMMDGSVVELPDQVAHLTFALQRPGAFGLSADDTNFFNEAPQDTGRQEAMLDRILSVGCGGISGSDKQHSSSDTPAIMLEISERNPISHETQTVRWDAAKKGIGMLTCVFWRESYPMNDRLIKFLTERKGGTEGITGQMDVLMKEWETQRRWSQTVQSFLQGFQYAQDPSKGITCVRCGQPISRDELIGTYACPRCGLRLA